MGANIDYCAEAAELESSTALGLTLAVERVHEAIKHCHTVGS